METPATAGPSRGGGDGGHSDAVPVSSTLEFMLVVGRLKANKRTGWMLRSVPGPESIADHMYRMSVLAFLLPAESVNRERCIRMALVHDMAESLVGDITPHCGISKEAKERMEDDAMGKIRALLADRHPAVAEEMYQLWREYAAAETPEAQLVKDLDKLEMVLQAYEYERQAAMQQQQLPQPGSDAAASASADGSPLLGLQEFFDSVEGKIKSDIVKGWEAELRALRASHLQAGPPHPQA